MGMFDWVRCTREMPDGLKLDGTSTKMLYQTKDMDCSLALYEIGDDNILRWSQEDCDPLGSIAKWVPVLYTGVMDISALVGDDFPQYRLIFMDGVLLSIQKFPLPLTPEQQAEIEAWNALTPEEQEAHRSRARKKLGQLMRAEVLATSQRKGFVRRFLDLATK